MLCREHLLQVQRSAPIWNRDDVQIVVVSFESADLLRRWAEPFPKQWHFVSDPERAIFEAYGPGRASFLRLFAPSTFWVYLRALLAGRLSRVGRREDGEVPDVTQLGADFVVARNGRVVLAWLAKTPAARPSMEVLAKALEAARRR